MSFLSIRLPINETSINTPTWKFHHPLDVCSRSFHGEHWIRVALCCSLTKPRIGFFDRYFLISLYSPINSVTPVRIKENLRRKAYTGKRCTSLLPEKRRKKKDRSTKQVSSIFVRIGRINADSAFHRKSNRLYYLSVIRLCFVLPRTIDRKSSYLVWRDDTRTRDRTK